MSVWLAPVGLCRNDAHEYYLDGAGPIPSVTRVLKVVDKSGPLIGWAKRITAEAAVRNLPMLNQMVTTGGEQASIDWLKKLADHKRDSAANLGTRVHALAESVARGQAVEMTDEEHPFVDTYVRDFLTPFAPRFLALEEMVCSLTHGYAGTFDAIAEIAGETWMLDLKTSTGTYAETALQLSAYANADFIARPGSAKRMRVPKVTRYGVIHCRPEQTRLVEYGVDKGTFDAFLACRGLFDWVEGQAKSVVGRQVKSQEGAAA